MNLVTLHADGRLEAESAVVADPLRQLGCQVRLADDVTLRSYFRMLETYPVFMELGHFFDLLCEQHAACPGKGCQWPDFGYLRFAKVVEMIGFPGEPRLEIYNTFQGIRGDTAEEIRSLPLKVLLDMPVRLGKLRHVVFGDKVDTFVFDTVYTLFEFIDGVAWELSFHGVPPECQIRS